MGKQYKELTDKDIAFIKEQKLFFVASSSNAEVNLSPKGYDTLYIVNSTELLYLDYPGSGNRTGRDIENQGEITLMFNAFEGSPKIMRLFCKGEVVVKEDSRFQSCLEHFSVNESLVRQFFIYKIYAVETSCGEAVPIMRYEQERKSLKTWANKHANRGSLETYIKDHQTPIDLKQL